MPSKQKGPSQQKSKKQLAEEKSIRASDQTFGLKNKKNSKKMQTHVARVQKSLTGNAEAEREERTEQKKLRRAEREAAEREERALFSEGTDVLKAKKDKSAAATSGGGGGDAADAPDAATARALARAKELFDAGAMTMREFVEYKNQILAESSDDDGGDEGAGDDGDDAADAGDDDDAADRPAADRPASESEEEVVEVDPRLSAKLEDLYCEVGPDEIDLGALPDDDADAE